MRKWIIRRLLHWKGEKGQSIVILAFAVVVLLAFVGLALDVGRLYGTRIQLSRAVDAAALAGCWNCPRWTQPTPGPGNSCAPTALILTKRIWLSLAAGAQPSARATS